MADKTHFEIFVCRGKGPKAKWSLLEAQETREVALQRGQLIAREANGITGVRVTKETFNAATGKFFSVRIFESGEIAPKGSEKQEESYLCFKPQDLYSGHAREVISEVLRDSLAHWHITPFEMLHRADVLEKLDAAGNTLQHAVQKVAIAQAGSSSRPVTEIIRHLQDLIRRGLERVFKDARAGAFPKIRNGDLGPVLDAIRGKPEPGYRLAGAIAEYLSDSKTWSDKLGRLIGFIERLPEGESDKTLCLETIDEFVCDIVKGGSALSDLLGEQQDLGGSIQVMTELFQGQVDPADETKSLGVRRLSEQFREKRLNGSKRALAGRIVRELKSIRRLAPTDPDREVELMRKLAVKLVMAQGPMLPIEEITNAFTERAQRMATDAWISDYLKLAEAPDERIERLIRLEENMVGDEAKRKLATFIAPTITAFPTEQFFLDKSVPITKRLGRIADLQRKLLKTEMPDLQKRQLSEALDGLAARTESQAGLVEEIEKRLPDPLERSLRLLRLLDAGILTIGTLRDKVRLSALKHARGRDGLAALQAAKTKAASGDAAETARLKELATLLAKADAEDSARPEAAASAQAS